MDLNVDIALFVININQKHMHIKRIRRDRGTDERTKGRKNFQRQYSQTKKQIR